MTALVVTIAVMGFLALVVWYVWEKDLKNGR